MSGHSHWSTIQRKKGAEDQKRGKVFSRFSKEIMVAARTGADPENNLKLRLAIERARAVNMPKEKMDNAIKKGSGTGEKGGLEEIVYEGFGPGRVGIIVSVLTDNRQRTVAEIKNIFEKRGGSLAGPGAVSYQFKPMGLIVLSKSEKPDEDILKIMDLGVEDVTEVEDAIEVYTQTKNLEIVKKGLEELGFQIESFALVRKPLVTIPINDKKTADQILELMATLEDHEEVNQTAANFDIQPSLLHE